MNNIAMQQLLLIFKVLGEHMRYILDVLDCVFEGLPISRVDLSARKRNEIIELKTEEGLAYFNRIIEQLNELNIADFEKKHSCG